MPKRIPLSPDVDRIIIETGKRRIAEAIALIPLERIQDLKILADIIDACLKHPEKTPADPDPIATLISLVRQADSIPSSAQSSPTLSGDSGVGTSTE